MARRLPKLYVLPASHPCAAVEAALALKSIEYRRVDLLPITPVMVGPLRWGGTTVPGMRINGERIPGSRPIMRRLDELAPSPPLLPEGEDARAAVLEAERWGDEEFQDIPRRIIDACFLREPAAMLSYATEAKLPLPAGMLRPAAPLTARLMAVKNKARDDAVRRDITELPKLMDRVDGWIAEGVLGGDEPNAADLQIGSTIRLLMSIGDVRPLIEGRRAAELRRYFPPLTGGTPAGALPPEWLAAPGSG